jgi:hypothetical protein
VAKKKTRKGTATSEPDFQFHMGTPSAPGRSDADVDEGVYFYPASRAEGRTWEFKLVSIGSWPEFKTETCYKRVRIPLDGWTKVPYPCAWRRTCRKTFFAQVTLHEAAPPNFERELKDCAKKAALIAVPLILAGQVPAAIAAFAEALKSCLILKGMKVATKLQIGIHSRKVCGSWKRV